jgi:hypothetical protein
MKEEQRQYHAVVWARDDDKPGVRVTLRADSIEAATIALQAEHGKDAVFTLYNEEDASRVR